MMALVLGPRAAGLGIGPEAGSVLLDTSVIIDGRITDIAQTGFLRDKLLVPHFVLAELQYIADSSDGLRRNRGRRGLEVLNLLQKEPLCNIEFIDEDVPDITEVDMKLIRLARNRNAAIMTNDYNLNRVAQLEGVKILNLNNLANALKPVVIPGEEMNVTVIKEGKEQNQGVPDRAGRHVGEDHHHLGDLGNCAQRAQCPVDDRPAFQREQYRAGAAFLERQDAQRDGISDRFRRPGSGAGALAACAPWLTR